MDTLNNLPVTYRDPKTGRFVTSTMGAFIGLENDFRKLPVSPLVNDLLAAIEKCKGINKEAAK